MRSPFLLLLCASVFVACNASGGGTTVTYRDTGTGSDAVVDLDQPVAPTDNPVPADQPVVPTDNPADPDGGAPADAVTPADVPADVVITPTACRSNRDCTGNGVCDRVAGRCAQCVSGAECSGATPVCAGNRCVAGTTCASSRMCPGQVCATARGFCADCVADADCTGGNVCVSNNCLPPPTPCASSRMCSASDQVCDASRGYCVDCVADADCATGEFCTPQRTCARQVCTPGARECLDLRRLRVCNANGSAWNESPCGAATSCVGGTCQSQICTPGTASCGSMTERRVCNPDGLGYTPAACAERQSCSSGVCRAWSCTPGATTCGSSTSVTVCNADGLSTRSMSCPSTSTCTDGRCNAWVCTPGTYDCESATSRRQCNPDGLGYSPAPCALPPHGVSSTCAAGACGFSCEGGWGNCDGAASNGCEADLATSAPHCGACGRTCSASAPGSTGSCVAGTCQLTCLPGFGDCDMTASNGCEASTQSDVRNCGACNAACAARPNSVASCTVGRCAYVCLSGYGDCDGNPANGCERALANDVAHCGRCDNACPTGPNAQVTCSSGACTFACAPGFSNCDGSASTGCEAVTATDLMNCGACGRQCAPANGVAACVVGVCSLASCNSGFGNCDGSASNGCETNLNTSPSHCGACNNACPGSGAPGTMVTCTATVCGRACLTGFSDCDGVAGNGCEANLASDARHCGACGVACPAGQSCVARVCTAAPPGQLVTSRYGHMAAATPDGRVYAWAGYSNSTSAYLSSVEMFDPATNTWTSRAALPNAVWGGVGAALADGRLLSIGGYPSGGVPTSTVYLYNPATNSWASTGSTLNARYHAAAARGANGRVYLFGGRNSSSTALTAAESYDPVTGMWTAIAPLPATRVSGTAVTAPDGRIYLMGGTSDTSGASPVTTVNIYDPATNTYGVGAPIPSARLYFGGALGTDGVIYLTGGQTASGSGFLATTVSTTPGTTSYSTLASLALARSFVRLVPLLDGRLLAVGGYTGSSTNRVEAYTPSNNTWR